MAMNGLKTALAIVLLFAGTHASFAEKGSFAVSVGGVRAGTLAYDATQTGSSYEMRGSARSSGLIGKFFDVRLDSVAVGTVNGNSYRPRVSRENTSEDGETVTRRMEFSNGVPSFSRTPPRKKPQKYAVSGSSQKGSLDTTTAAYAILRDRPAELACQLDLRIFDGAREHRIVLDTVKKTKNGLECTGRYMRVAGFSPKELSERGSWPLTMEYTEQSDGTMRVSRLSFPTSFGRARLSRL